MGDREHYSTEYFLEGVSAEEAFNIVADIASYPSFVPWCAGSEKDTSPSPICDCCKYVELWNMEIGFRNIHASYISRVHFNPSISIKAESIDHAVFSHMESLWTFSPQDNGCLVGFEIEYIFSSLVYCFFGRMFFNMVSKKMVEAFRARCTSMRDSKKISK